MTPKTFGIIGFGHFGAFLAEALKEHGEVLVTDVDQDKLPLFSNGVRAATLDESAGADIVVLAVPFDALPDVLRDLKHSAARDTVIMDVVSTKARATGLLQEHLADHENVIATHPLFGPPSMRSVAGERIVITFQRGERTKDFRRFLEQDLKLHTVDIPADEHDRRMAYMQALPFFIARALVELEIPELARDSVLSIPSFEKLALIASIEQHHSRAMFETSQISNPYAQEARERLLEVLDRLNRDLISPDGFEFVRDRVPAPAALEL
jgi:prephenate dehydrogenase